MKRVGKLFERVVDRDNLRLAFSKAMRGKRTKRDAREFAGDLESNLKQMASGLWAGTFPLGLFHQFTIHDPKERLITAPCFSERVLHHAIMNVCDPVFERFLIHDSYACRVGRGRIAALNRARRFARQSDFFLKLDIRRYFDSISHSILCSKLARLFKDRRLAALFRRIIDSYHVTGDHGLPIGSLTSQHFANFYLGWFDRFVKEELRVRGYVRYMDDSVLWADSSRRSRDCLDSCRHWLASELELTLKPEPFINRTRHGMDFLGCRVFRGHMTLNRRSRNRFAADLKRLETTFRHGQLGERELQNRVSALVAFTRTSGVRSWQFRQRVLQQMPVSGRRPRTG